MQHRYVGDIGDYVKLALLRALSVHAGAERMGVVWCLVPDESHNKDGKHTTYLKSPREWRPLDEFLFDHLSQTVASELRRVEEIERSELFAGFSFFSEEVPCSSGWREREEARERWLQRAQRRVEKCALVFVDPDNGLAPERLRPTHKQSNKSIFMKELLALRTASGSNHRALLVYQHQSRRRGGHYEEIRALVKRFTDAGFHSVDALRAKCFSPRVFLLLDAEDSVRETARQFSLRWASHVEWNPHLSTPS